MYLAPQFVVFIMWREKQVMTGRFYTQNFFLIPLFVGGFLSPFLFLAFNFLVMLARLRLFPCLPTQRRQTIAKTTAYPASDEMGAESRSGVWIGTSSSIQTFTRITSFTTPFLTIHSFTLQLPQDHQHFPYQTMSITNRNISYFDIRELA